MTDAQRRYMKARQRVDSLYLNPLKELLDATFEMCADERHKREASEEVMAQMRPLWAQGYTDDSMAAQATGNALAEIWKELGVTNQTASMEALRMLRVPAPPIES